mgnify:FL=1
MQRPGVTRRKFLKTSGAVAVTTILPPRWARAAAMDPFVELDATEQAALVRRKEVQPIELVDAAIHRIEALNPQLNSFVTTCFERARQTARGALPDGPFRGVPYAIKDLSDFEGVRMTMGSRLFADNVADENNGIVQRALATGVVVLGKTNTPEFGLLPSTESLLLGPTRNPWNLAHSPGGSSGGAAAAVAAGILPFAQASDGGGSIRIPASCCGVFGLKPSRGRIFRTSKPLPGDISVRFAVSRSVRDSATMLAASELAGATAPLPAVGVVAGPAKRRLRIAFTDKIGKAAAADPEVSAALRDVAHLCERLGHRVVEAAPAVDGDEFTQRFLALWASIPAQVAAYAWLIGLRQLRLVTASDVLEPWTLGLARWLEQRGGETVSRAVEYCKQVERTFAAFFADHDVLLTPVLASAPVPIGVLAPDVDFERLLERVTRYAAYTPPFNAAGLPAMSVPLSWSADGLPIGSQFATRIGGERTLLELAYELEQERPWARRWPSVSAAG